MSRCGRKPLHPYLPFLAPKHPQQCTDYAEVAIRHEAWTPKSAWANAGEILADVVFYDAFAQAAAPELWTAEALRAVFQCLAPGGVWVSYAATGLAKRTARDLGMLPEKRKGFGTKREMMTVQRPFI